VTDQRPSHSLPDDAPQLAQFLRWLIPVAVVSAVSTTAGGVVYHEQSSIATGLVVAAAGTVFMAARLLLRTGRQVESFALTVGTILVVGPLLALIKPIYPVLTILPLLAVGLAVSMLSGRALAKLSFRLVPDQEPAEIERLVRRFIARVAPPTVRATLRTHIRSRPALIDRKHPAMQAAATAYRRVFGRVPRWVRSGGSIPAVSEFTRVLDVPTVLMGFASPGDGLHGPNEKFSLKNFQRGILCSVAFLESLGRTSRNGRVIERAGQVVLNGY